MERPEPAPVALWLLLLLLPVAGRVITAVPEPSLPGAPEGGIRINVTTLKDDGEVSKEQVVLNITYESGQVSVNDLPVNSGVTRISCQTLIVKNDDLGNLEEKEYFGIVNVRILVHELPMTSGSSLQLIVIQEVVVEIDGRQVQQKDVIEIDILVKDQGILTRSNYTLPLEESMLYSISPNNDILFTLPNLFKKESVNSLETTSQHHIRNVETTVDEHASPGKLPETPHTAEPTSSHKECALDEKFRKGLHGLWKSLYHVIFIFINVMSIGIIASSVLLVVLKLFVLDSESKDILQVDKTPPTPINLDPENLEDSRKP
ncbi:glycoprotein integral membrane protein 1 isoform X2 [Octodon degus]|uniref:Glycoprotein integral membrane protein 1 isoform X2 n=1 Tax=Octodon degus TaxID=10160 RepID=A0A6P6DND2_OCTDE|nr:glycoprotein integral membrane protein 1 isoform X2 [Octodon degus]